MNVTRLNHAVLWVRDARASAPFYVEALGFEVVEADAAGRAVFLRAGGSANHHDLGLFSVGDRPSPAPHAPGLYHLAWQVATIDDLADAARALGERDALVGATDHGVSKSLYAKDPDGIEFEVMWQVPREHWGAAADHARLDPLDLTAEVARWRGVATASS
ncbi:MAG: VOC family protein [Ilumatobacteraceae bacterium]